ncbi:thiol:disulfide interchange protein DsbA/DsbL [Zooshikella harenae]|uniref:Thiol:disulfide interchange protein DsbA n=1 Tax=Zooshikella harenae TaxID=2827238 RepID=A0ABS5Z9T2_9GAMM|nr:thiol:disulfide interchange protein DsbA/DsbL [Zooshikella harenae]MBU2710813.1 thiol:disulfide interchange protein DsbA/DsbL [Zooshikella harenae]
MIKNLSRLLLPLAVMPVMAIAAETFQEGKDYIVLSQPVKTADANKVNVTEVFSYSCPHCYNLEPYINKWAETLPEDVKFQKIPAVTKGLWGQHARLFFTINALKLDKKVHSDIFNAFHKERNKLAAPEAMAKFLTKYDVKKESFEQTFNSFGVSSQMNLAAAKFRGYRLTGVPAVIVNGKYRVNAPKNKVTAVADFLIEKERALLKEKAAPATTAKVETKEEGNNEANVKSSAAKED